MPPDLLILLLRYVEQYGSSSGFPSTGTTLLHIVGAFIVVVLFILMSCPVCADTKFSRYICFILHVFMTV